MFRLLFISLILLTNALFSQPRITSFSPKSGPVGTSVSINGTNFSPEPTDNIVFFGAVRGNVISASETVLKVIVPRSATYNPISVTSSGLTAFSSKPFNVTFESPDTLFRQTSFSTGKFYPLNEYLEVFLMDLDNDGYIDLITRGVNANPQTGTILVYKNLGGRDSVKFAPVMKLPAVRFAGTVTAGDIDGDGKPEIVSATSNILSIFKNVSTDGTIGFEPKVDIPTVFGNPSRMVIGNFDNDGKPDIAAAIEDQAKISIYKNISTGNVISFTPYNGLIATQSTPSKIIGADFNLDGRTDLGTANVNAKSVSVVRQGGSDGPPNFLPSYQYQFQSTPGGLAASDLDGDDKPELLVTANNKLSLLKNISGLSGQLFDPAVTLATGPYPLGVTVNDLDGDGRQDIAVVNWDSTKPLGNTISVFKNKGAIPLTAFQKSVFFSTKAGPEEITSADLTGDGKPELIVSYWGGISIFKNQVGEPLVIKLCPDDSAAMTTVWQGSVYQWQISTDNGVTFKDISDGPPYYMGGNTKLLKLYKLPSSFYGNQYRCVIDGKPDRPQTIKFEGVWTGMADNTWENPLNWGCGSVPDANMDVVINDGSVVLNSNVICRSLTVDPLASFSITPGKVLTIQR